MVQYCDRVCICKFVVRYIVTGCIFCAPSALRQQGADLAFLQGGGGFDPSSTSRVAASRFFLGGGYFTSREAASRLFFFFAILRAAKRRADFFGDFTSREAASRFFLAILRAAKRRADFFWLFYEPRSVFSSPGGGGGGCKPYCLRLSLRQSAIGTYCVGLDIL